MKWIGKRGREAALAVAALATVALAGCSSSTQGSGTDQSSSADSTSSSNASASPSDSAGDPVTINWWHIQTGEPTKPVWDEVANAYMELHPDVTIVQTALSNEDYKAKLATAMQAGDPPDIFHSWGGATLADYGKASLIKDLADSVNGEWADSLSAAALNMNSQDGHVWAVPFSLSGVGIWYNKALFEKAGITTPPATWPEFMDAVKKLKAAGITPIALGNKEKWPGMYWYSYLALRAGGEAAFQAAVDRTGSFDSPAFVEAGARVQELLDAGAFPDGFQGLDYGAQEVQMATGKAAMELMGDWSPSVQIASDPAKKGLGEDLGFMAFPTLPDGAGNAGDMVAGTGSYAVGSNAPDAAVDFLKFFTSLENESKYASKGLFLTVAKGSDAAIADPNLQAVEEALISAPYLQNFVDQLLPPSLAAPFVDAITGLFAGTSTPQQVASDIESAAQQSLD